MATTVEATDREEEVVGDLIGHIHPSKHPLGHSGFEEQTLGRSHVSR